MRKKLIQLPEGINPGGVLTIKAASWVSGFPESTIRNWRRQPGIGLRFYRVNGRIENGKRKGGILVVKCDEFLQWINLVAVEEASMRRITFASDSKNGRTKDGPGASVLLQSLSQQSVPRSPRRAEAGIL